MTIATNHSDQMIYLFNTKKNPSIRICEASHPPPIKIPNKQKVKYMTLGPSQAFISNIHKFKKNPPAPMQNGNFELQINFQLLPLPLPRWLKIPILNPISQAPKRAQKSNLFRILI